MRGDFFQSSFGKGMGSMVFLKGVETFPRGCFLGGVGGEGFGCF